MKLQGGRKRHSPEGEVKKPRFVKSDLGFLERVWEKQNRYGVLQEREKKNFWVGIRNVPTTGVGRDLWKPEGEKKTVGLKEEKVYPNSTICAGKKISQEERKKF